MDFYFMMEKKTIDKLPYLQYILHLIYSYIYIKPRYD